MKLTPWYLAAIAPIAVAGCSGTLLGHFAVLAVTLGIFVGTLSLGRHPAASAKGIAALEEKPWREPSPFPARTGFEVARGRGLARMTVDARAGRAPQAAR